MAYAATKFVESSFCPLDGDADFYECSFLQSDLVEIPFIAFRIKLGKNGVEAIIFVDLQVFTEYEAKGKLFKAKFKASIEKDVSFAQKQATTVSV
ncbi:Malate dehydrogenase protein [Thalictrum thalictroides]|uniref:Malate dehydrogenase protein n=1 Tax=Thalictrum thalictroides TaxID=46969 RepID=A0A7J6WWL9_THATH|nr:Malate dehydrogenase protein [Thalictrum thalictroides]